MSWSSTGTGSGKTEAFLYPIVDDLLRQRDKGITSGLTAILIYPMNALANDQLDRLRDMLGGTGITFGQWVGTTPDTEKDVDDGPLSRDRGGRHTWPTARKRRDEAQAEDRAVRPLAPPEECCSEEDIRERKPRILLTNYRQLEVLTTRSPDVALFAEAPIKYLVFDEAHTYSGATGAEVACLVRRVRALAGKKPDEIICIGTSATLSDPGQEGQGQRRNGPPLRLPFLRRGRRQGHAGRGILRQPGVAEAALPPAAPRTATAWTGWAGCWTPLTEPVKVASIKAVVEELTGQTFDPGDKWQETLFDHAHHQRVRLPEYAGPAEAEAAGGSCLGDLAAGGDGSAGPGRPGQRRTAGLSGAGGGGTEGRRVAAAAQGPLLPAGPGRDGGGPRRHRQGAPKPTSSCH